MYNLKLKNKKRRGFTLIEMVIVITIIGLLSGIAVTKFSHVQKKAKENADYATASNLATAAMIAMNDVNKLLTVSELAEGGYIQFVPKPKSVSGDFTITKDSDDSIKITAGGNIFYPKESYKSTSE